VAAALATIVVTIILWRVGPPRRVLLYSMPAAAPMVSSHWPLAPDVPLKVVLDDEAVTDPHVVVLQVDNKSRRDIRSSDFDQDRPLAFDLSARVLATSLEGSSTNFSDAINFAGTQILLGPALIGGGESLLLTLITEGPLRLACRRTLVNVKIREEGEPRWNPGNYLGMAFAWVSAVAVSVGGWTLVGFPYGHSLLLGWLFVAIGLVCFMVGVLIVHFQSRKR
jgi:hypothetical protein